MRHQRNKVVKVAPIRAVKSRGLRYVMDSIKGITRRRHGKNFLFFSPRGVPIRNAGELRRIRALAIPPAWKDVWISPFSNSHLQATGRDARGRKQYRYHHAWREWRDQTKYDHLMEFGRVLPKLRRKVAKDLSLPGLPRAKVMATIVRLLETTCIRIGNDEYVRQNQSFGLTTLRNKHVKVRGSKIHFRFRGKSGIVRDVDLNDHRLAQIVRHCQDLPGQELFQYLEEDGTPRIVNSSDVNQYLREATGVDLTAKDFRTWAGTVLAARALGELPPFASHSQAKRNVVQAVEAVARKLGNTRAVCQKCYIHPATVKAYFDGSLPENLSRPVPAARQAQHGLSDDEAAVMMILEESSKAATEKKVA
ncbi:MAG TPA: DNA topoisomerase IB [Candidatus Binatia bacterium]|nr:DNA topoisomerase IB [Candidatus Binatia bacterium]